VKSAYEPIPLLDFIPALTPRWTRPDHLAELTDLFERARTEAVEAFATCPPQHGKTEVVKHAVVQRLLDDPTTRIAYGSYTSKRANKISREIRSLYLRAGGKVERGAAAVGDWRTGHETGGLWAAGVDGSWTGEGFNLAVLDDPIKGRKEAESPVEREALWNWKITDLDTRMHPGSSTIAVHTRWHVDDLGGRLIAEGYEHHRMPAISDAGVALWPARYPIKELLKRKKRMGEYSWEALYMGRPFARGGRVFDTSQDFIREHSYVVRPAKLRIALGCDFAYSKKTSADWSVFLVLGIDDIADRIYVLDVIRRQVSAPVFSGMMKTEQVKYPGIDARWYYAGAELGIADFVKTLEVNLEAQPAAADKGIRALPVAAAWAAGRIWVPKQAEWLDDFLAELGAFTGVADLNDDQVDSFAAAFDSGEQPGWIAAMNNARLRGGQVF
jgi:predicted phage terminase large subunit-like protein